MSKLVHYIWHIRSARLGLSDKLLEREIPTATVEGLLLLKLYALPSLYRQGNFAQVGLYENDIATLMYYYRPAIAPLLEKLRTYLAEGDMAELREIVREIERRFGRFQKDSQQISANCGTGL